MDKREAYKFIYWTITPMAIGFVLFMYIDKMDIPLTKKVLIFLAIVIPTSIIRTSIGLRLFKEKPTLAEKIMGCKLRRKYGNNYCTMCKDSYACADL